MWPDRVSNPGPLTYESGALPTTIRGPAQKRRKTTKLPRTEFGLRTILSFLILVMFYVIVQSVNAHATRMFVFCLFSIAK